MKLVAEYLERAHQFERMAASEKNPNVKAEFAKQAQAYRNLAEKRAEKTGVAIPKEKRNSD